MNTEVMFSSKTDEWETPQDLFDKLVKDYGEFTLDVCATPENAKCKKYFTKEIDGLSQSWQGEICWMNPPYGREIGKWVKKAYEESKIGNCIVFALLPARTDTAWFHDYIYKECAFSLLRGRLKFGGSKNSAPFPSMIVIFRGVTT
jgi:phage N-6-adenine-methyltransferase